MCAVSFCSAPSSPRRLGRGSLGDLEIEWRTSVPELLICHKFVQPFCIDNANFQNDSVRDPSQYVHVRVKDQGYGTPRSRETSFQVKAFKNQSSGRTDKLPLKQYHMGGKQMFTKRPPDQLYSATTVTDAVLYTFTVHRTTSDHTHDITVHFMPVVITKFINDETYKHTEFQTYAAPYFIFSFLSIDVQQ